jgi:methionine synthase II (cobalamin-independent)
MIRYFEQLPGLDGSGGNLHIVGKVRAPAAEALDDFYKLSDYQTTQKILHELGRDDVKAKVTLTGPMTLGTICASSDIAAAAEHYNLDDEAALFTDFADALLPIAKRALELGAYVQFDEPLLSTSKVTLETARAVLENFAAQLPKQALAEEKISLHVCGSIKSIPCLYETLLYLDFPILSLGFSGPEEKENLTLLSRASFEDNGKTLGAGFCSNITVEDPPTMLARYRQIEAAVGKENIKYLHPDCGFGLTKLDKVREILANMQQADIAIG